MVVYGIKNCDTVKKTLKWLTANDLEFTFFDYKKEQPSTEQLTQWIETFGLMTVVNKRGTTYRNLSDEEKASLTTEHGVENAIKLLTEHTSMIKRPIVETQNQTLIGFKEADYQVLLT
jgi:Spx/MgsR family transcriptional regulator